MVLQAAMRSGRSLADLLSDVTLYAQTLINVRLAPGASTGRRIASSPSSRVEVDRELGDPVGC